MAGTVIITGANGSLAVPAVHRLLTTYPDYTAILTVRDASDADINTKKLRNLVSQFPNSKASIRQLNLAELSEVNDFANSISAEISTGKIPPLAAVICNAYYWNLSSQGQLTGDGFERTFQVNHLAQAALVLKLLPHFNPEKGGRIVLFSSDAHWPGKNGLEKLPPTIPEDLDLLVKPDILSEKSNEHFGHGFQRYANSKLAIVMWMYALNRYLELKNVSVPLVCSD